MRRFLNRNKAVSVLSSTGAVVKRYPYKKKMSGTKMNLKIDSNIPETSINSIGSKSITNSTYNINFIENLQYAIHLRLYTDYSECFDKYTTGVFKNNKLQIDVDGFSCSVEVGTTYTYLKTTCCNYSSVTVLNIAGYSLQDTTEELTDDTIFVEKAEQTDFSLTSTTPAEANLAAGIVSANGVFVAGSYDGVWYSSNGTKWEIVHSGSCEKVCFINNYFIALVDKDVCYSTDGMNWTVSTVGAETASICYGNGKWVVGTLSGQGGLYYSTNLSTWTKCSVKNGTADATTWLNTITYANNMFQAGSTWSSSEGMFSSTDGINWTKLNNLKTVGAITYYNGIWIYYYPTSEYSDSYYSTDNGVTYTAIKYYRLNSCIVIDNVLYGIVDGYGVYTTTDCVTWTRYNSSGYPSFNSYVNANGVWVGTSYVDRCVYYSTDNMKTWEKVTLVDNNNYMYGIAYNGSYIAIAADYDMYGSATGNGTYKALRIMEKALTCCCYANNMWVGGAVDQRGLVYTPDHLAWEQSNIISGNVSHVTYKGGYFVACIDSTGTDNNKAGSGLYYSTDGKTWTQCTYNSTVMNQAFSYAYAGGWGTQWVACGTQSSLISGSGGLWYSSWGKEWYRSNITTGSFKKCYAANDMWVAVGSNIYYSEDAGHTWTVTNVGNQDFSDVKYANGKWIALSNNGVYYSTDGKTWTKGNLPAIYTTECAYGGGVWIAGGYSFANIKTLYYSTDGINWSACVGTDNNDIIYKCIYADGIWIASGHSSGGSSKFYHSTDGINWTEHITSDLDNDDYWNTACAYNNSNLISFGLYSLNVGSSLKLIEGLNSVDSTVYANGLWVTTASSGIWYSEDGLNWTQSNITKSSWYDLAYCGSRWIAGGYNGICYSYDGKTWYESNITSRVFSNGGNFAYGNGVWVCASNNSGTNALLYSTDCVNWQPSNMTVYCYNVIYANGIFMAGGNDGIYKSTDGINWTMIYSSQYVRVRFEGDIWYSMCGSVTQLYYSKDIGATWTKVSGYAFLDDVKYANGMWVATIRQDSITYYSNDGITFNKGTDIGDLTGIVSSSGLVGTKYLNNKWYVYGTSGLFESANGKNFVRSITPIEVGDIAMAKGIVVIAEYWGGLYCGRVKSYLPGYNEVVLS